MSSADNSKRIKGIYRVLFREFGPQGWWPVFEGGEKPAYRKKKYGPLTEKQAAEVCFGAILTQNASWKNAEKALANLEKSGLIGLKELSRAPIARVRSLIRPSGYYRQKAERLRLFSGWALSRGGKLNSFFSGKSLPELREELLEIKGVGPETADSMLLYSALKPSFVIDAYTKRIYSRYFSVPEPAYEELKSIFEAALPAEQPLYAEFHALLVELAKRHCLKNAPKCGDCPLKAGCRGRSTGRSG